MYEISRAVTPAVVEVGTERRSVEEPLKTPVVPGVCRTGDKGLCRFRSDEEPTYSSLSINWKGLKRMEVPW